MAYYWEDARDEIYRKKEHPQGGRRMSYDRSTDEEKARERRTGAIAAMCIIAAIYGIWHLDELSELFTFSNTSFRNGLMAGVIIGLVLHFRRRRQQKKAWEEEQILEDLKEIKEQEKEEEFISQNHYHSSGT